MSKIYDWEKIASEFEQAVDDGKLPPQLSAGAEFFGIPYEYFRSKMKSMGVTDRIKQLKPVEKTVKRVKSDGTIKAKSTSLVPKTPEELAEMVGIDLADYSVAEFKITSKEVYTKDVQKDLYFDEGRISGEISQNSGFVTKTLWSCFASFKPKVITESSFLLQPVRIEPVEIPDPDIDKADWRALVVGDFQVGWEGQKNFHDKKFMDSIVQLVKLVSLDEVIILGDLLDLSEFTDKFLIHPLVQNRTNYSIMEAAVWLMNLRQVFNGRIRLFEGNHEERFRRSMVKNFPQGANLVLPDGEKLVDGLPVFMSLDGLGVDWVSGYPDNSLIIEGIEFSHGNTVVSKSGGTVSKVIENSNISQVFGHIHRQELAWKTITGSDGQQKEIFAFSPGCGCLVDGSVPGSTSKSNWQQGLGIISRIGGKYGVHPITVADGKIVYGGLVINGKETE